VALPQTPARKKADDSGAGWFPVVEITNRSALDQLRTGVLATWQAKLDARKTTIHKVGRPADPREQRIEELAAELDRREPDEAPF